MPAVSRAAITIPSFRKPGLRSAAPSSSLRTPSPLCRSPFCLVCPPARSCCMCPWLARALCTWLAGQDRALPHAASESSGRRSPCPDAPPHTPRVTGLSTVQLQRSCSTVLTTRRTPCSCVDDYRRSLAACLRDRLAFPALSRRLAAARPTRLARVPLTTTGRHGGRTRNTRSRRRQRSAIHSGPRL